MKDKLQPSEESAPPVATVAQVMAALAKLPPDLPCYFRPKYHGDVRWCDDVPVNPYGISEMQPDPKVYPNAKRHVCFLC